MVTVFADIVCPFTHVGLRRMTERRDQIGSTEPPPGERVAARVGQRRTVGRARRRPSRSRRCGMMLRPTSSPVSTPTRSRATSVPALGLASLAYTLDLATGESVSLALRDARVRTGPGRQRPRTCCRRSPPRTDSTCARSTSSWCARNTRRGNGEVWSDRRTSSSTGRGTSVRRSTSRMTKTDSPSRSNPRSSTISRRARSAPR